LLRKFSFCNRITNLWNGLPEDIVAAQSLNSSKNKLDKHWHLQELRFNWRAEITGTGSKKYSNIVEFFFHFITISEHMKPYGFVHANQLSHVIINSWVL